MKRVDPPEVLDLVILDTILNERMNGNNAGFFTENTALLQESWRVYIEETKDLLSIQPNQEPWYTKEYDNGTFSNLYKDSGGSQSSYIKSIREKTGKKICPYCGRPQTFPLDHFLPKVHFPQFAFLSKNLILCCSSCNKLKSNSLPENNNFYPHPYYEELNEPLYSFLMSGDLRHPTFHVQVTDTLPINLKKKVEFLVDKLNLNSRLCNDASDSWDSLIGDIEAGLYKSEQFLNDQIQFEIDRSNRHYKSSNEIQARFLTSLQLNTNYLNFLITLIPRPVTSP